MKQVFDNIKTTCAVCGTPLNGRNLLRIGSKYYCRSDYQKVSAGEKLENKLLADAVKDIRKILYDD